MENANLNPKHRSRTKRENPLLQHTKARGVFAVAVKFYGAFVGRSDDDKDFKDLS